MNTGDIHRIFDTILDKNSVSAQYGGCPSFLPEEKDIFLNQAFLELVSQKLDGVNNIPFEGNPKRISDLQGLINVDKGVVTSVRTNNVVTINDFDNNHLRLFPLTLWVKIVTNGQTQNYECKLTTHNVANNYIQTSVNTPWVEEPMYYLEDNTINIILDPYVDQSSVITADISYIKYPTTIDSSDFTTIISEVPDTTLYEIINRAAVIALENIESQRTTSKVQLNQLSE